MASVWWSKHHVLDISNGMSTCTAAQRGLKGRSEAEVASSLHNPPGATPNLPLLIHRRHLISGQSWQCNPRANLPVVQAVPRFPTSHLPCSYCFRLERPESKWDPSWKSHDSARTGGICPQPKHSRCSCSPEPQGRCSTQGVMTGIDPLLRKYKSCNPYLVKLTSVT